MTSLVGVTRVTANTHPSISAGHHSPRASGKCTLLNSHVPLERQKGLDLSLTPTRREQTTNIAHRWGSPIDPGTHPSYPLYNRS